jgi:hypothetical protein
MSASKPVIRTWVVVLAMVIAFIITLGIQAYIMSYIFPTPESTEGWVIMAVVSTASAYMTFRLLRK